MHPQRIRQLLSELPDYARIYNGMVDGISSSTAINRSAYALMDPSFPWHFAMVFVTLRQDLPPVITEEYILNAYELETVNTGVVQFRYRHIIAAKLFRHPSWLYERALLEALLIIPAITLREIAELIAVEEETVEAYEQLFWNVRDRLDDKLFIKRIVWPDTRHVENRPDYWGTEDPKKLMLRAAYDGDVDSVCRLAGLRTKANDLDPAVALKEIKSKVLGDTRFILATGAINQHDLEMLKWARSMLVAESRNKKPEPGFDDWKAGLGALSISTAGESIIATVKGLQDDTKYNEMKQRQDEKRRQEDSGGPKPPRSTPDE